MKITHRLIFIHVPPSFFLARPAVVTLPIPPFHLCFISVEVPVGGGLVFATSCLPHLPG